MGVPPLPKQYYSARKRQYFKYCDATESFDAWNPPEPAATTGVAASKSSAAIKPMQLGLRRAGKGGKSGSLFAMKLKPRRAAAGKLKLVSPSMLR